MIKKNKGETVDMVDRLVFRIFRFIVILALQLLIHGFLLDSDPWFVNSEVT